LRSQVDKINTAVTALIIIAALLAPPALALSWWLVRHGSRVKKLTARFKILGSGFDVSAETEADEKDRK